MKKNFRILSEEKLIIPDWVPEKNRYYIRTNFNKAITEQQHIKESRDKFKKVLEKYPKIQSIEYSRGTILIATFYDDFGKELFKEIIKKELFGEHPKMDIWYGEEYPSVLVEIETDCSIGRFIKGMVK